MRAVPTRHRSECAFARACQAGLHEQPRGQAAMTGILLCLRLCQAACPPLYGGCQGGTEPRMQTPLSFFFIFLSSRLVVSLFDPSVSSSRPTILAVRCTQAQSR